MRYFRRIFCCGNENVKTITRRPTRLAVLLRGRVWVLRRVFTSLCVFRAFHALIWRQTRQQRQLLNEGLLSDMYNKNLLGSMTSRRGRPRVAREARALRSSSKRARHRASHAFLVTSYGPEIGGKPGMVFAGFLGRFEVKQRQQASTLARLASVAAGGRARGARARRAAAIVALGGTAAGAGSAAAVGRAGAGHVGVGSRRESVARGRK